MKKLILFLFFIFLLNQVSSFSLEVSPDEISINSIPGLSQCKEISISASENSEIVITDRWAEEGTIEKILTKHKLNPEDLNLEIEYEKSFSSSESQNLEVCFTAKYQGFYHGVLLVKGVGYPAGVGVWVNFNVTQKESAFTGFITKEDSTFSNNNLRSYGILILVLIILLEIFILVRKKRNH